MKKNASLHVLFAAILFFSFIPQHVFSQEASGGDIHWVNKLKVPFVQDVDVLKMDDNVIIYQSNYLRGIYGGGGASDKSCLYRIDLKNEQRIEKHVELKTGDKRRVVKKMIFDDNKILVFSSFRNEDQKKFYVFQETINPENLELNNDVKKIFEMDCSQVKDAKIKTASSQIRQEKGRIIVYASFDVKDGEQCFVSIYDSLMSQKAHYAFQCQSSKYISGYTIDYSDNFYYLETERRRSDELTFSMMYFLSNDNKTIRQQSLTLENKQMYPVWDVNKKNEVVATGLYYQPKLKSAQGTYSIIFPPYLNGSPRVKSLPLNAEFLAKGLGEKDSIKLVENFRKGKEYDGDLSDKQDVKFNDNGEFTLTTQGSALFRVRSNSMSYNNDKYKYGGIYVFTWNADGSPKWSQNINLKAELFGESSLSGGYYSFYDENKNLNIIYTNFNPRKIFGKNIGMNKDVRTILATFSPEGEISERILIGDKKDSENFIPSYTKYNGSKQLIVTRIHPAAIPFKSDFSVAKISLQ
jgi:hypothetical protein